jgi:hypothetical protein
VTTFSELLIFRGRSRILTSFIIILKLIRISPPTTVQFCPANPRVRRPPRAAAGNHFGFYVYHQSHFSTTFQVHRYVTVIIESTATRLIYMSRACVTPVGTKCCYSASHIIEVNMARGEHILPDILSCVSFSGTTWLGPLHRDLRTLFFYRNIYGKEAASTKQTKRSLSDYCHGFR